MPQHKHQQLCIFQTEHSRKMEGREGGACKETFVTLTLLLYTSPEEKPLNIHWACDTKGCNCQGTDMKAKPNWFQILWRVGCLTRWKFFANKHFNNNSLYFPAFSFWLPEPTGEGRRGRGVLNGSKWTSLLEASSPGTKSHRQKLAHN